MKTHSAKEERKLSAKVGIKATAPIILFGNLTLPPWVEGGGGGGGGPQFPGNDPFPGGDPGSGGVGGGCGGYGEWMAGQVTVASDFVSETVTNIDPSHRTITYTWIPFKQVGNIYRYEKS